MLSSLISLEKKNQDFRNSFFFFQNKKKTRPLRMHIPVALSNFKPPKVIGPGGIHQWYLQIQDHQDRFPSQNFLVHTNMSCHGHVGELWVDAGVPTRDTCRHWMLASPASQNSARITGSFSGSV
jgi:hypothetical protein